jgi:hypothetical protein
MLQLQPIGAVNLLNLLTASRHPTADKSQQQTADKSQQQPQASNLL